jgi:dipeptidyl-peptidase-4
LNTWGGADYIWYQYLCQKGYIVVCFDGRGTGGRGVEFKKTNYKHLGSTEIDDEIEAVKYLYTLPYVDTNRIGIWGWSYGGYATLMCMMKGSEYFKTGVAVAPVTDWRFYDNIYTERFMQRPVDNPEGYEEGSVLSYVNQLKGNLLIIHGSADDNVHLQNTMELASKLVEANKQFEMQIYPNKNHGIYGGVTTYHLFKRITEFLLKNL